MSKTKRYALLGATGATGSAVLRALLEREHSDLVLNVLVRSKDKLFRVFPELEQKATFRINIFEGDVGNRAVLASCLAEVGTIFMCVAQNGSQMGTDLALSTATAIRETLWAARKLQGEGEFEAPTIVNLRSASLNPPLAAQTPKVVHKVVMFCLHYSYADVRRACTVYEAAAAVGLMKYIWVDPPTLHDAQGEKCTGHALIPCGSQDKQATALSYADLGAAISEIAERQDEFMGQAVGVTATGKVNESWGILLGFLISGAWGRVTGWWSSCWAPTLLD